MENWIGANVSADGTYAPIQVSAPASSEPAPVPEEQPSGSEPEPETAAPASSSEPAPEAPVEPESGKTLVVYFSASGNTKAVAEVIAKTVGADTYELTPAEPYTSADLNWTDENSRVNREHNDPSHRTALAGTPDLSGYDTIFLGYPLWWREAPSIVWNFVENADLSGKTMIPFCTSTSSPFGSSGDTLKGMAPNANWLAGERFGENLNESAVTQWVNSLNLAG